MNRDELLREIGKHCPRCGKQKRDGECLECDS